MKCRRKDKIILQLVSCTFLHLQPTVRIEPSNKGRGFGKRTDPQPASGVRLHDLSHIPHELGEGTPNLPMLDHKTLWVIIRYPCHGFDVGAVFPFASHISQRAQRIGRVWDPKVKFFRSSR